MKYSVEFIIFLFLTILCVGVVLWLATLTNGYALIPGIILITYLYVKLENIE